MNKPSFALLVTMLLGACGGTSSDLDPGAGDDPGQGTSTLTVRADVRARPQLLNAHSPSEFDTDLSVHVSLNQRVVTTGTVTITSASGPNTLTYRADREAWEGIAAGYDEVYILDIESGSDRLDGVRVDGPDIHAFAEPTAGASVDSTLALLVAWTSDQEADSASIDAEQLANISIPDTRSYMLAAGALKADKDRARENMVGLRRANRITPRGAAAGSELSVSVENQIQVIAQANPAL